MCYQLVEVYTACQCLYYKHAVDRCQLYPNHIITQRTILVGYACAHCRMKASLSKVPAASFIFLGSDPPF